jgi:XRE family transcriptional regulator, regulator of sulfur utilization
VALEPSGVAAFDELLGGGLVVGDNIVWVVDDRAVVGAFAERFLRASIGRRRYVRLGRERAVDQVPDGTEVVDLHRRRLSDPAALEAILLDPVGAHASRLVVEGLDELVLRWGAREAATFYRQVCPRLFDLGAIAYWIGTRAVLSASLVDDVAKVAQCVFDLRHGRLRVTKAEGRPSRLQGAMVKAELRDGELELSRQHAVGRVGEGLTRLRRARGLTQAQLARLAGVTPAAISQAESGRRSLSLDTLLPLCERLGIGLDDLLGGVGPPDYVLARRDRFPTEDGVTPLLDDPGAGMRAHLVRLEPGQHGSPHAAHKGAEMVLVAQGLVLVDLGRTTPVVRAGDAVMATRVPIRGWSNLGPGAATLFWVLDG